MSEFPDRSRTFLGSRSSALLVGAALLTAAIGVPRPAVGAEADTPAANEVSIPEPAAAGSLSADSLPADSLQADSLQADSLQADSPAATKPDDGLAPIDLGTLSPIMTDVESIDPSALQGGLVCTKVRTIRSWIPRRVCRPSYLTAAWPRGTGMRRVVPDRYRNRLYRSLYQTR